MPRLVRLEKSGPMKLEPSDKPVFVCACGLSKKFPICDGSHKGCAVAEPDPSKVYVYDQDRARVIEVRDDGPANPPTVGK